MCCPVLVGLIASMTALITQSFLELVYEASMLGQ